MTLFSRPLCAALAAAFLSAGCATRPTAPIEINLVALNDFHGHLDSTKFQYTSIHTSGQQTAQAGGVDTIAAAVQAWRREDKDLLFVGAGDLIGASPAMSSMWADEPALEALSMAGMRISSVGNHEFDNGRAELLRQQRGGCESVRPEKACQFTKDFRGAGFTYLAANVIDDATGKPFLPAYRIEDVKGVKVGLIGAVLRNTASVVLASGIVGLTFEDEASAINRVIPAMRAEGAQVFVVLIHEGGTTPEPFDKPDCSGLKGPVVDIVKKLDPAIRVIVSGHSHTGFQCKVDGRVVTQGEMGGHVLSRIRMMVDPASGAVGDIAVRNVIMKPGEYPPDERVSAYLKQAKERSEQALGRPVARVALRSIHRKESAGGETVLGGLIADAVLAATKAQGVQIGFMNMGGMRQDLDVGASLTATYGDVQIVLPFGNTIVAMDMTGAQIRALLEQQWARPGASSVSVLQVSEGFSYRWNKAAPKGQRVIRDSVTLNGKALDDTAIYRVAGNNFLAEGGDAFPAFAAATNKRDTQIRDIDAVVQYLIQQDKAGKPAGSDTPPGRIGTAQ